MSTNFEEFILTEAHSIITIMQPCKALSGIDRIAIEGIAIEGIPPNLDGNVERRGRGIAPAEEMITSFSHERSLDRLPREYGECEFFFRGGPPRREKRLLVQATSREWPARRGMADAILRLTYAGHVRRVRQEK